MYLDPLILKYTIEDVVDNDLLLKAIIIGRWLKIRTSVHKSMNTISY